jgi:hypothetical protein
VLCVRCRERARAEGGAAARGSGSLPREQRALVLWSARLLRSDAEKHPRAPVAFFSNESACGQAGRVLLSIQARAPRGPNLSSFPINNHLVIYQALCQAQTAKLPLPKSLSSSLPIPSSASNLTIGNARSCLITKPASRPPRPAPISPGKTSTVFPIVALWTL